MVIIVFVLSCIVFFYNALKIQHGSKNFPTPKEESKDGPLDEIEDEYQRYAEEELEKNTKQMESFKGEDAEVIPEKKKLTKDERLALIKESAEKKSFDERLRNRGRRVITERTIYVPKLGNIHSIDSGIGDSYSFFAKKILLILWSCKNIQHIKMQKASHS